LLENLDASFNFRVSEADLDAFFERALRTTGFNCATLADFSQLPAKIDMIPSTPISEEELTRRQNAGIAFAPWHPRQNCVASNDGNGINLNEVVSELSAAVQAESAAWRGFGGNDAEAGKVVLIDTGEASPLPKQPDFAASEPAAAPPNTVADSDVVLARVDYAPANDSRRMAHLYKRRRRQRAIGVKRGAPLAKSAALHQTVAAVVYRTRVDFYVHETASRSEAGSSPTGRGYLAAQAFAPRNRVFACGEQALGGGETVLSFSRTQDIIVPLMSAAVAAASVGGAGPADKPVEPSAGGRARADSRGIVPGGATFMRFRVRLPFRGGIQRPNGTFRRRLFVSTPYVGHKRLRGDDYAANVGANGTGAGPDASAAGAAARRRSAAPRDAVAGPRAPDSARSSKMEVVDEVNAIAGDMTPAAGGVARGQLSAIGHALRTARVAYDREGKPKAAVLLGLSGSGAERSFSTQPVRKLGNGAGEAAGAGAAGTSEPSSSGAAHSAASEPMSARRKRRRRRSRSPTAAQAPLAGDDRAAEGTAAATAPVSKPRVDSTASEPTATEPPSKRARTTFAADTPTADEFWGAYDRGGESACAEIAARAFDKTSGASRRKWVTSCVRWWFRRETGQSSDAMFKKFNSLLVAHFDVDATVASDRTFDSAAEICAFLFGLHNLCWDWSRVIQDTAGGGRGRGRVPGFFSVRRSLLSLHFLLSSCQLSLEQLVSTAAADTSADAAVIEADPAAFRDFAIDCNARGTPQQLLAHLKGVQGSQMLGLDGIPVVRAWSVLVLRAPAITTAYAARAALKLSGAADDTANAVQLLREWLLEARFEQRFLVDSENGTGKVASTNSAYVDRLASALAAAHSSDGSLVRTGALQKRAEVVVGVSRYRVAVSARTAPAPHGLGERDTKVDHAGRRAGSSMQVDSDSADSDYSDSDPDSDSASDSDADGDAAACALRAGDLLSRFVKVYGNAWETARRKTWNIVEPWLRHLHEIDAAGVGKSARDAAFGAATPPAHLCPKDLKFRKPGDRGASGTARNATDSGSAPAMTASATVARWINSCARENLAQIVHPRHNRDTLSRAAQDLAAGLSTVEDNGTLRFMAALKSMATNFERGRYGRVAKLTESSIPTYRATSTVELDEKYDPLAPGETWSLHVDKGVINQDWCAPLRNAVKAPMRRRSCDKHGPHAATRRLSDGGAPAQQGLAEVQATSCTGTCISGRSQGSANFQETMRRFREDLHGQYRSANVEWTFVRDNMGRVTLFVPQKTRKEHGARQYPTDLWPEETVILDPGVAEALSGVNGAGEVVTADLQAKCTAKKLIALEWEHRRLQRTRDLHTENARNGDHGSQLADDRRRLSREQREEKARRCDEHMKNVRRKMKRVRRDYHSRVVGYIVTNYRLALLPKFGAAQMVRRKPRAGGRRREISKRTVVALLNWSHCELRERLVSASARPGVDCTVVISDEPWTSKTCHACGQINSNLGGSRRFECSNTQCGLEIDRDTNGALNIFLRYLTLSSYAPTPARPVRGDVASC
jgi:hypothetical protein